MNVVVELPGEKDGNRISTFASDYPTGPQDVVPWLLWGQNDRYKEISAAYMGKEIETLLERGTLKDTAARLGEMFDDLWDSYQGDEK